jgi:prevent-host-death family protein
MNSLMSISDVRANLPDIVAKVGNNFGRVTITVNGQPKAVLVSAEELESLEETAEILAIPGAKKSIKQGLKEAKKGQGTPLSALR